MGTKRKINRADAKHAKTHDNNLVETDSNLNLDKPHKKWYLRQELGKQRGKPQYSPPKEKKSRKEWKNN